MRIAAIVCAAVLGFAGSASAACNWSTAKTDERVAAVTEPTPAPSQSTPVKLPDAETQS